MQRPIEKNSSRDQAVYEPFSGSETTIIIAGWWQSTGESDRHGKAGIAGL
jgi:hypothetical protein